MTKRVASVKLALVAVVVLGATAFGAAAAPATGKVAHLIGEGGGYQQALIGRIRTGAC